jgi:hypothetical protein
MNTQRSLDGNTGCGGGLARLLTVIFMLLTVLVFALYVFVYFSPYHPINPFPPYAHLLTPSPTVLVAEAATIVPTFTPPATFPPTWTPTFTPVPTETFTPRPTSTPKPPTPTPTLTPRPIQFATREAPITVRQQLYGGASTWWTGVAGEVSDRDGQPVTNVVIRVWDDKGRAWETTPGSAANYAQVYGTSLGGGGSYAWWEQVLEGSCQQSFTFHVQVLSGGQPASRQVTTKTSGNCQQNLVLIHFVKNW